MNSKTENLELRAVADFLGRLLLREVDAAEISRLGRPELAPSLDGLGIELPAQEEQDAWIEERAADFHELFLRPETGPLVQSLWTEGRYEGDSAVRVRQLAEAADATFDSAAARGAAIDHLGSLLLLWSATDGRAQPVADELVAHHLTWSLTPLGHVSSKGGFYGAIARATVQLVATLTEREGQPSL